MSVSLKTYVVDTSDCENIGTAGKKIATSIIENMGLTVIEVKTETSGEYLVNVKYGNDDRLMIQFDCKYLRYNTYGIIANLYRKADNGDYTLFSDKNEFASYSYGAGSSFTYKILELGEIKIFSETSLLSSHASFMITTLLNTVNNAEYTVFAIIIKTSYSILGEPVMVTYLIDAFLVDENNRYAKVSKLSDASDALIPNDGKVYLVPVRIAVNEWNLIGILGKKDNLYRSYCNVDGVLSSPIYLPGQPVTIGNVSGIGYGTLVYVDK